MRNTDSIADLRCCLAALAALFVATASAAASTPEAWEGLFAEAGRQCAVASGLLDAAARAQPVDLGDAVLLLIGGMWPQPHMKRAPAHLLCRYSKATGEATVVELPADWRAQLR